MWNFNLYKHIYSPWYTSYYFSIYIYSKIKTTLEDLGLYDEEDEYIISFNGAGIVKNFNFKWASFLIIDIKREQIL